MSAHVEWSGRKVTVLGLAREGVDLARFLCRHGARVRVSDQKTAEQLAGPLETLRELPIEYSLGGHPEETLDADVLYVSPGVAQELSILEEARQRGITVSSATQLLLELAPCPVVAITGSSGKTTTTSLVGEMLKASRAHVLVGGNIGVPLLNRLEELTHESWLVLELSSFQLETVDRSPHVAAVTNVTPNHLDRHPSMEAYAAAKARIFQFQQPSDWAVLNAEDPGSAGYVPPGRVLHFGLDAASTAAGDGAYLLDEELTLIRDGMRQVICQAAEVRLRGRHNLANILAAAAVGSTAGVHLDVIRQAATTFSGVAHRLEIVGELNGVQFVDDSIATSPERSIAALRAYDEPVVLIAGGRDKHLPMEEWAQLITQKARHVVLLGEMSDLVERAIRQADPSYRAMTHTRSMEEAVSAAANVAQPGDVVLLSPGGTSFDMFIDFEQRGRAFAEEVGRLGSRHPGTVIRETDPPLAGPSLRADV